MSAQHEICTFVLGPFLFGVDVEDAQEVIRNQATTPVPLAPTEIPGLINLRGEIVPVIDLRRRLELPEIDSDQKQVLLIVKHASQPVGLLVDQIEDVMNVDLQDCEPPPGTLQGIGRDLIQAACKLPDRLLLLLDVARVVDVGATVSAT